MSGQPIAEQGSVFHIRYGGQDITCHVLYKARKTMEIAVHPDGQVVITAPLGAEMETIQNRVRKRARWITRQIAYFQQFQPRTPHRRYVGGETHLYLGRQYRLKLEPYAKLKIDFVWLNAAHPVDANDSQ